MYNIADFQEKNKKNNYIKPTVGVLAGGGFGSLMMASDAYRKTDEKFGFDEEEFINKNNVKNTGLENSFRKLYRDENDQLKKEVGLRKVIKTNKGRNDPKKEIKVENAKRAAIGGGVAGSALTVGLGYGANKIRDLIKNNNKK